MRAAIVSIGAFASLLFGSPARAESPLACARDAETAADLRDSGRFEEAMGKLLACARDECPRVVRIDCRAALAELERVAPRILVRVRTHEGRDVTGARVAVDERPWTESEQTLGRIVDIGTHLVRVEREGARAAEQVVVITRADRMRSVEVALPAPRSEPRPASTIFAPHPAPKPDRRAAYAIGTIGASMLIAAGVLGGWTFLEYKRLESSCAPGCFRPELDTLRTRSIVADAALGGAVVTFGIATVLWLTAEPSREQR